MKKIECRLRYKHPQELKLIEELSSLDEFGSLNQTIIQWALIGYYEVSEKLKNIDPNKNNTLAILQVASELFQGTGYDSVGTLYVKEMLRILHTPSAEPSLVKRVNSSKSVAVAAVAPLENAPDVAVVEASVAPAPAAQAADEPEVKNPWGNMGALCGVDAK